VLARYPGATVGVAQEEARNSGMFRYVQAQLMDRFGINPACRSRVECGSPSTGSEKMHKKEEAALVESVFTSSDADGTLFESAKATSGAKPAATRS
jgi:2-oxoglutarate dehydrogenase complex dehydrogenase (E1) component-like enzyme